MLERFNEKPADRYYDPYDEDEGSPEEEIDFVRKCVSLYRDHPEKLDLETLFMLIANGMFHGDPDRGIYHQTGHVVFRLSDFIDSDRRGRIAIYPASPQLGHPGEIIIEGVQWQSLEQWRQEWAKKHPVIPEYVRKLASGLQLDPGRDNV